VIRILLVDDQPVIRHALRTLLTMEPDMTVIDEAPDGRAAVQMAQELRPDVVVMDVNMPRLDGPSAAQEMRRLTPKTAVIILSLHHDDGTRARALAAGAAAFIEKQAASMSTLMAAIRLAAQPA
jgi:DNA-binding NarL/FixJ family response regulator